MMMISTTQRYCQDVWEAIQKIESADITVKTFGNVGNLIHRFSGAEWPVVIFQQDAEFLVYDPDGKSQQHFDLELLHQPEFRLSEPEVECILADREMALGRLHVKQPHNGIKRPLVICDACGKMINRYESRYAYRNVYTDANNTKSNIGKLFVHFDYQCLKYHLMVPSTTKKSHTMPGKYGKEDV